MRGTWCWLGFALGVGAAHAQEVRSISVDEALRLAEERAEQVAIARAGVSRAEAERLRARSEWFPQVAGSASYERTLASRFEGLSSGGGGGFPGADLSRFGFGARNTYLLGVSVQQNLFAGGRTTARLELAASALRTAELSPDSARAQAVLEAVQAYYDAVLADRLLEIAEANLEQARLTFEQTRVSRESGAKPEFDLLRAQVAFENQRPVVLQRQIERRIAGLRLKQLLELPLDQGVKLTSQLEGELPDLAAAARSALGLRAAEDARRVSVRQASAAVQMRQAALRVARSQRYPQVSLNMSYGRPAFPRTLFPERLDDFLTDWTAGVQVQLPLFTGLRITGDERVAQADLLEARARLRQAEELAELDTRTTAQTLQAAEAAWQASAGVMEQAVKAHEIARLRYHEGVSTQLELSDARLLLEQAAANRARAARELQVARVRLALLPLLPFGGSSGMTEPPTGVPSTSGTGSF